MNLLLKIWNWITSFSFKRKVPEEQKIDHTAALEYMAKLNNAKRLINGYGMQIDPAAEARQKFQARLEELKNKEAEEKKLREKEEKGL